MKRDLENSITNYNESVLTVHQVRMPGILQLAAQPSTQTLKPLSFNGEAIILPRLDLNLDAQWPICMSAWSE